MDLRTRQDLAALSDRREDLADLRVAPPMLAERLRANDSGQHAVAVPARDARRIFCVGEPVQVRQLARRLLTSLRDEDDVAQLLEARCIAIAGPDRVNLVEGGEHVCA